MIDPRETGRPLDEHEAREFERIVAAFARQAAAEPTDDAVAAAPEPAPVPGPKAPGASDHPPLTWRQAVLVLVATAVFAALTATLPSPLNLWAPVAVLAVLCLACVVWGRVRERRLRSRDARDPG